MDVKLKTEIARQGLGRVPRDVAVASGVIVLLIIGLLVLFR